MRPKFQLALDLASLDKAGRLAELTCPWIDWIEAGTPLIISEGLEAVRWFKRRFPQKTIVADVKVVDAARLITGHVIDAGADILTVLSAASDQTIAACVEMAHSRGCQVLGDHISTGLSPDACRRLADLGVDFVGIHIPKDSGEGFALSAIERVLKTVRVPVVVAGGIQAGQLEQMAGWPLSAVVVGGAILNSPNPEGEAQKFAEILGHWHAG